MIETVIRRTRDLVARPGRALPWLPFVLLLGWTLWLGLGGQLRYDLRLVLLAGGLGTAWLAGMRLWPLVLLFALLLSPLAWRLEIALPRQAAELRALGEATYLRVRGMVRQQVPPLAGPRPHARLLLGEAVIHGPRGRWRMAELEVTFPRRTRRMRRLYRREVIIGGELRRLEFNGTRPRLVLESVEYRLAARPMLPWRAEGLRAALGDRAAYYLHEPELATYLPIVLGVRGRRSPEARKVVGAFRRVGISHLFAISGLHIGLLFLLLLAVSHAVTARLLRGQGMLRARTGARVGIMALIWGYIALIGFPIPAVRAAIMVSMVVWSELWGTRTPKLYLLALAGLILVGITPTVIYDVSFQLSFLSFFFLLSALELHQKFRPVRDTAVPRFFGRAFSVAGMNLAVTLAITIGIWPVVALNFGQISLLVFVGNLLMIPLLSLLVLPSGLLAMLVSLAHLGRIPGGWAERLVFGWLEWVLAGWLWLIRAIDEAGRGLVFPVQLDWQPRQLFLYYALLLAGIFLLGRLARLGRGEKTSSPP